MVNTLSELQKRAIAYSGQADIGDVPPLYAAQRAAQQAAAEQALGGTGMGGASGAGGVAPLAAGLGGGGAVGGTADIGLPGTTGDPVMDATLASGYRQTIIDDRADPRGAPGRDAQNPDVEAFLDDYFGFLQNPGVIGASAPFVGPVASVLGPYFGAEDVPESAPLGPMDLIGYLAGKITGGDAFDGLTEQEVQALTLDPISPVAPIDSRAGADRGQDGGRGIGDPGRGTCFAAGTVVLMADMTECPIERIQLGDKVMAFYEAGPPEPAMVVGVHAHKNVNIVRVNGSTLTTANHPFFAETRPNDFEFVPAEELKIGQPLMGIDGEKIVVETIEKTNEVRDVFNITVEGLHTYFANGYRVHNKDVA